MEDCIKYDIICIKFNNKYGKVIFSLGIYNVIKL